MRRDGPAPIQRPVATLMPVLATSLFFGLPGYYLAFFVAYAFRESVGWGNQVAFVALIAIYGAMCGLSVLLAAIWEPVVTTGELFAFGIQSAWALNALVVAVGSIVSANHKDQGSVTDKFSTPTDVLVAAALFGTAAFFSWKALRLTATH